MEREDGTDETLGNLSDTSGGPESLPHVGRLRWQCRRGMLELDLLLEPFLDSGYGSLAERDQWLFVELLGLPDQILLEWLVGHTCPENKEVMRLVATVRDRVAQG
jgi:antitoxin CptB